MWSGCLGVWCVLIIWQCAGVCCAKQVYDCIEGWQSFLSQCSPVEFASGAMHDPLPCFFLLLFCECWFQKCLCIRDRPVEENPDLLVKGCMMCYVFDHGFSEALMHGDEVLRELCRDHCSAHGCWVEGKDVCCCFACGENHDPGWCIVLDMSDCGCFSACGAPVKTMLVM